MMIKAIRIYRYALPFKQPLPLGNQILKEREGLVLEALDADDDSHFGEVAPLATVHRETLTECLSLLATLRPHIQGRTLAFDKFARQRPLFGLIDISIPPIPSVIFALEQILLSMMQKADKLPLLSAQPLTTHVTINSAHLLQLTAQQTLCALPASHGQTFKFKIGRRSCTDEIAELARLLRSADGTTSVRLDANRSFDIARFNEFWKEYQRHIDIIPEFIEEPLQDAAMYQQLERSNLPPLALDETLWDKPLEAVPNIACYILKPSRIGGISACLTAISNLTEQRLRPVLSSCYESSLSLISYGQLAAFGGITQTVMGLGTFDYFAADLLEPGPTFAPGVNQIDLRYRPLVFAPGMLKEVMRP